MSIFDINFTEEKLDDEGDIRQYGLIKIGDFSERFASSPSYCNTDNYCEHWKKGVSRLISGEKSSALITDMYDPI